MVCKGDSGDGLVVVQTVNDEWRYFLQGVVTNSYRSRGCDDFIYTMATNVQHYGDFLRESIGKVSRKL